MDVDRTIEFLLKNQAQMDARFDAKFAKADQRFAHVERRFAHVERRFAQAEKRLDRLEQVMAQNNRIVTQLARSGVTLRSDVRRTQKNLAEVSEKLNILIDVVEGHIRGNGRQR